MTKAMNTKRYLTGFAGALALAMTLFTAPAAFAGDRGDRWERDRSPRVERNMNRDREVRRNRPSTRRAVRKVERRAVRRNVRRDVRHGHRRNVRPVSHRGHGHGHRHVRPYVRRRSNHLVPLVAGIGLGILTYAIIDSHRRY